MIRATSAALFLFLVTLTGVTIWLGTAAHKLLVHLDGVATRAEGIETKANATLMNLDKGTATWAASAMAQTQAITDLATDAHGMISQANTALESIPPVAQSLVKTADAGTATLTEATDTIKVGKRTIASFRPVAEGLERNSDDLDAILRDNAIHQTFTSAAATLDNANGILADGRKVADKAAADFLKPVPWWKQPIAKGGELIDITAAIARHVP
jgi:hypothetical protein